MTLRDIVFADDERRPSGVVAGEPQLLEYMPVSLLLQAEGVDWTLPSSELPNDVPRNVDKRGLFQLLPANTYLRVKVGTEYISVRRTTFQVTAADTITVYAATRTQEEQVKTSTKYRDC